LGEFPPQVSPPVGRGCGGGHPFPHPRGLRRLDSAHAFGARTDHFINQYCYITPTLLVEIESGSRTAIPSVASVTDSIWNKTRNEHVAL